MNFNTLAEPDLLLSLKTEAREAGEDWREWIFGQLESATEDWKLAEILDQAIDEAQAGKP